MRILPLHPDIDAYIEKRNLTRKFAKQARLFELNIFYPSLETELLEPREMRVWSFRVDRKYRAIFIFRGSDMVVSYGSTEVIISSVGVNFEKEIVSNTEREIRYIDIVDKKVFLQIGKKFKFVDMVIIQMPINSDRYIARERVKSISFIKYVKKNDPNALPDLISFISRMNITAN